MLAELIIFGGSGGIGQYLIKALSKSHRVFATYHSRGPSGLDPGATYYDVDVTKTPSVDAFLSEIREELQHPVLVYSPGISPNATAHKFSDADWESAIAVNLTGAMRAVRAILPTMRERKWGRVILISSVLARLGVPGTIAYSATKAGLSAMARVVAAENARKGVTANALALGYYGVGIISAVPKEFLETAVLPNIPQGKLGDPANIAAAVRFLIDADYMSGATLDINGGMIGA